MKTLTCRQMGGECDAKISGSTKDEMMMNGMKHLEEAHPKMAEDVKKASPTDPMMVAWNKKFDEDFKTAPEM
jgi:predicted small metal-binding protein